MPEVKRPPEANSENMRRLMVDLILRDALVFAFSAAVMFLSAGRLNWPEAVIFWIIYLFISLASGLYLIKIDSSLMQERRDAIRQKNVKTWDRWILAANMVLTLALFVLIGFDAGRYQWSRVPLPVRIIGGSLMLLSFALTLWASRTNTFMSSQVRIQSERGHQVISNGPYAIVRHPMYAAMGMLDIGMPLLLDSWFGLMVSFLMIAVVILRVILEERTLLSELPGYSEYCGQVRFRLIPGIW
jgi:protein-S-isoprenylcysteine O-methyltransferase Ste14